MGSCPLSILSYFLLLTSHDHCVVGGVCSPKPKPLVFSAVLRGVFCHCTMVSNSLLVKKYPSCSKYPISDCLEYRIQCSFTFYKNGDTWYKIVVGMFKRESSQISMCVERQCMTKCCPWWYTYMCILVFKSYRTSTTSIQGPV